MSCSIRPSSMISDRARLRCFDSMMMMEFRCSLSCSSSPSQVSILRRCAPSCCVARHVTECAYVCHVPLVVLVPRSAISRSARHRQLWYATRQAAQHQGWHAAQVTGHGAYSVGVQVGENECPRDREMNSANHLQVASRATQEEARPGRDNVQQAWSR